MPTGIVTGMPLQGGRPGIRGRRVIVVAIGMLSAAALIVSTFLGWTTTTTAQGKTTSISGWGTVSMPGSPLDGANIEQLAQMLGGDVGSYRPALPIAICAALILLAAIILAASARAKRPSRIAALVLGAAGLGAGLWALLEVITPGTLAGILPDAAAGPGPILALIAGMTACLATCAVLLGQLDTGQSAPRRGIQPG